MTDGNGVRLSTARALPVLGGLLLASACADGDPLVVVEEPRTLVPTTCDGQGVRDAAGSEAALEGGRLTLLDTTPPLANVGDNVWHVRVEDADEAAVVGASLGLTALMPVHGHPSTKVALATDELDGTYVLGPVALSMPGVWLVDVTVASERARGRATFSICVGP